MTTAGASLCLHIMELRVQRNACLRGRIRDDNSALALLSRMFGETPADRKKPGARSQKVWGAIVAGKPLAPADAEAVALAALNLEAFAVSRRAKQGALDAMEKEARAAVKRLPVANFVAGVSGFGPGGLFALVGEAGDLANYPHPRMLWKRMGLMPWNGSAGSNCGGKGLSADDWKRFGYVARRRAAVRAEIEEPMLKHQIESAAKSETPFGRPKGRYGEIYVARRERNARERPDWTPGHAKDDATRIMAKALISDLWSEWRRQHRPEMDATDQVAAAAENSEIEGAAFEAEGSTRPCCKPSSGSLPSAPMSESRPDRRGRGKHIIELNAMSDVASRVTPSATDPTAASSAP